MGYESKLLVCKKCIRKNDCQDDFYFDEFAEFDLCKMGSEWTSKLDDIFVYNLPDGQCLWINGEKCTVDCYGNDLKYAKIEDCICALADWVEDNKYYCRASVTLGALTAIYAEQEISKKRYYECDNYVVFHLGY